MKVPDLFIPEKNLGEQTESLKFSKKNKVENLTDFIIKEGLQLSGFVEHDKICTYEDFSPFLNKVDVIDGIFIDYGKPTVEIIEFRDDHILKLNINNLVEYALRFNDTNNTLYYIIVNDAYLGFVYASNNDEAKEIADNYINRFGFEAHEIISARK